MQNNLTDKRRKGHSPVVRFVLCLSLFVISACRAPLGECDNAALSIVYTQDSTANRVVPMYDGQALLVESCGAAGGNCHNASATGDLRQGVPLGFDLNLQPYIAGACDDPESALCLQEQHRLRSASRISYEYRRLSFSEVEQERMPPTTPTSDVSSFAFRAYIREQQSLDQATALPSLATDEGKEIVRNWFACGAPVVGRVEIPTSATTTVGARCDNDEDTVIYGDCVTGASVQPVTASWADIHSNFILRNNCASPSCHGGEVEPNLMNASDAYSNLVGQTSAGNYACGTTETYVVPNNPDASLFFDKINSTTLNPPSCGDPMAQSRTVDYSQETLDAIRAWIDAGAPDN